MKCILVFLVLLIPGNNFAWMPDINKRIRSAQMHIYNAEFGKAQNELNSISHQYPAHPVVPFLKGIASLWELGFKPNENSLIQNSISQFRNAYERADSAIKLKSNDSEMYFWRGISNGLGAACDILLNTKSAQRNPSIFRSGVSILKNYSRFRSMINDSKIVLRQNPEFADAKLVIAVFDLYSGEDYRKKMENIWSLIESCKYLEIEATYLIIDFIYGQGSTEDLLFRAIPINLSLCMRFYQNFLFELALAKLYYEVDYLDDAKSQLIELINNKNKPYFSLIVDEATFFLGTIAYRKRNYEVAIDYYAKIVDAQPRLPLYVLPWTLLRAAQCHWHLGQIKEARNFIVKVQAGPNVNNVHSEAKKLLGIMAKR